MITNQNITVMEINFNRLGRSVKFYLSKTVNFILSVTACPFAEKLYPKRFQSSDIVMVFYTEMGYMMQFNCQKPPVLASLGKIILG